MFENVPWLRGKYLNYRGYFALVFMVSSCLQIICSLTFYCIIKYIILPFRILDNNNNCNNNNRTHNIEDPSDPLLLSSSSTLYNNKEEEENSSEIAMLETRKIKRYNQNFESFVDEPSIITDSDDDDRKKMTRNYTYIPYKLDKICKCFIIIQSFIMFTLVSLLSFGGGGKPILLCTLAVIMWIVIGSMLYFVLDKQYNIRFYKDLQPICAFLLNFWSFILLLQFSAWSLINPVLGVMLCFFPVQIYILYCYHQLTGRDMVGLLLLNNKKKQMFCIKNTAFSLVFASIFVLVFTGTCVTFFNPTMAGGSIHLSVIGWNSWLTRSFAGPSCPVEQDHKKPCHVYLTLPEDPSTSIFLNVHVGLNEFDSNLMKVEYWKKVNNKNSNNDDDDDDGKTIVTKQMKRCTQLEWIEANGQRDVYSILLNDLQPNSQYEFQLAAFVSSNNNKIYKFKTLPGSNDNTGFSFMTGGDSGTTVQFQDVLSASSRRLNMLGKEIEFSIIGGDLAYGNNLIECYHCWDHWLNIYEEKMKKKDETLIPLSVAVGNHDAGSNAAADVYVNIFNPTKNLYWEREDVHPPFIFSYFPQHTDNSVDDGVPDIKKRLPYHYHIVGGSMIYFILDSGHVVNYDQQKIFIDKVFHQLPKAIDKYSIKLACYHVPIYPSTKSWDNEEDYIVDGIQNWVRPIFDKYKFTAIFENHQHTMKRTKPMRNSKYAENGTIYFGDGNLGITGIREHLVPNPLIETINGVDNHAWIVDIINPEMKLINYTAINRNGNVIDHMSTVV